jgi:hypothetical protein
LEAASPHNLNTCRPVYCGSLSLVSAPGSKATPFVFMFHWEAGQYQLSGVGAGNKAATDAAFREIGAFTGADILGLLSQAQAAGPHQ